MNNNVTNISIYKDKNRWVAQIEVGRYANGKRKYKRFYAEKKKDALARAKDYLRDNYIEDIFLSEGEKFTVEEFLNYYLTKVKKNEVCPSTYELLTRTVYPRITREIGHYYLRDLTEDIIQTDLIDSLISKKYSNAYVRDTFTYFKTAMKYAYKTKKIYSDPCVNITLPKEVRAEKEEVRFLNEEEIERLAAQSKKLNSVGKPKYKYGRAILLALYTGLRCGELCALKWTDVNFDSKILRVNKISSTAFEDGKRRTVEANRTKTKNSDRYIYLNNSAVNILNEIKASSSDYDENNYIVGNSSKILHPANITLCYTNMAKSAGIENPKGIHTLRHTFATMLIYKGVDIKVVSELLGHSSVVLTYNLYVHVLKEQKTKAVDLLDF